VATAVALWGWEREQRGFVVGTDPGEGIKEEHTRGLLRFGALRAPATLFSQLIFWTDLFVLAVLWNHEGSAGAAQVGIYSAVLRASQAVFLFLTSVSLTFSPFVADLHHRGERDQLDALYKNVTRWTLAATIPVLLVLGIMPAETLRIFGADFAAGADALRIVIVGMIVSVMVGTVGFILIMAGRTGWDLVVYLGAFAIDIGVAATFAGPDRLGIRGAALAQALASSFSNGARLLLVKRFLGIWPFDRAWLRLIVPTVLAALTMGLAHAAMPNERWFLDLLVSAAGGGVVYVGLLLAIGLSPTERAAAARLILRRPTAAAP
jgi:O-antigen/teichoic acid export membrane protein